MPISLLLLMSEHNQGMNSIRQPYQKMYSKLIFKMQCIMHEKIEIFQIPFI